MNGFIKKKPWLFKLGDDFSWDAGNIISTDITFDNQWLNINQGIITVKQGYTWDGCSDKWVIADLWVIGTADGRLRDGVPITYHASLIHDALTQFHPSLPITHQQATAIFNAMLKERRFFWRKLYVFAVSLFGPRNFLGNRKNPKQSQDDATDKLGDRL